MKAQEAIEGLARWLQIYCPYRPRGLVRHPPVCYSLYPHACLAHRVIGEAGTPSEALAVAAREQPDVILLDLNLDGTSGLDLLPELLATADAARVLILTGVSDPDLHRQAVSLGALGLVLKGKNIE